MSPLVDVEGKDQSSPGGCQGDEMRNKQHCDQRTSGRMMADLGSGD